MKLYVHETRDKTAFYVCSKKKTLKCMVSVTLDLETDMIERVSGTHNHGSDLLAVAVKKIIDDKMVTVAENPTISPRSVMTDITSKVLNHLLTSAGLSNIPK